MALVKTPVDISFATGIDTKTDPKRVPIGTFLALQNSVFDKSGALSKRNGYPIVTKLPNAEQTILTTLNNNLLATGSNLYAYSEDTNQWLNQGIVQPVRLSTQSMVRSTTSQVSPDAAVAATGLTCLVYVDTGVAYYQISDSTTGQQIVQRTALPTTSVCPRVFILGRYFIITFLATVGGSPHLQYIAIPTMVPTSPRAAADISTNVSSLAAGYDAYSANNNLFLAWEGTSNTVQVTRLTSELLVAAPKSITSANADLVSVTVDATTNTVWVNYWDSVSNDGYVAAYSVTLAVLLAPVQIINNIVINELTSISVNNILTSFYEVQNTYSYSPNAKTDYVEKVTTTITGTVGTPAVLLRSVGLASKPFIDTNVVYVLIAYGESSQPTYFLTDSNGNICMRLAYSNGGGYASNQVLPSVTILNDVWHTPYLIKDFLVSVNKETNIPSGTPTGGIYTQTGINLAKFSINTEGQYSSEIANTLHLTGGIMWQYDGVKPVELGFHVYPENNVVTTSGTGGLITANTYYYQFCYEWTDNQGNLHRSAPSIPISIVTTGATSSNTLKVPTLRLTYKISPNPVRIVGYRWSVAQQSYYQFTSITSPTINDPSVDSVTIVDTKSDAQILGQTLLYTTGGVIENIAPPAAIASALYKNRLFLVDAENPNNLWYSKQVVQNTPVEFSDLLTLYVAPTSGAQGSTGPVTAISAMDDKFIIFKKDAIYYITGSGPDATGAQNDFSEPTFITSAVGCSNPNSIVLMPNGLMFQSDKGIWLLDRGLQTTYIGAGVEQYNAQTVKAAKTIPATNQVRFILDNNITLMYDYYMGQWGTHTNILAISGTLWNGADTYLNSLGAVHRETPNVFVDGSTPVLVSFTTGWISLAGIQGLERFYEMYILGKYFTPFKLQVQIAYDFNTSPQQSTLVLPDNYGGQWGSQPLWGSGQAWGGPGNVLSARVFPEKQKCETFQLIVNEIYDPSYGVAPGQGLILSGLNLIVGTKRGYRAQKSSQSFG